MYSSGVLVPVTSVHLANSSFFLFVISHKSNNKMKDYIEIIWDIDDVLEVRPDLTKEQAREVLHALRRYHDANSGINWDVIYWTAHEIYPKKED